PRPPHDSPSRRAPLQVEARAAPPSSAILRPKEGRARPGNSPSPGRNWPGRAAAPLRSGEARSGREGLEGGVVLLGATYRVTVPEASGTDVLTWFVVSLRTRSV